MPVFSALIGANAAKKSAKAQENASKAALALQKEQFGKTEANFAPWVDAGKGALSMYQGGLGLAGEAGKASALTAFRGTNPGYDFMLGEGIRARDSSAAARGALSSGGYQKELTAYGSGLADQTYGTWLDRLNGISTQGSNAAGQLGSIGQNYANAGSQALTDIGAAKASGYMGVANAAIGGLSQLSQLAGSAFGYGGGISSYGGRP